MAELIVDSREPDELTMKLSLKAPVKVSQLFVGDYIINGSIAIERKERGDLEQSIIDGRLFKQLDELLLSYKAVVLIIEGTKRFERINRNALIAAISSYLVRGVSVFFTRNYEETAELIYWIAKKYEDNGKEKPVVGKKPKSDEDFVLAILETLPGVSIKLAKNIAKHFSSLKELFNASPEELQKVEGIGKEKAKRIYKVFNLKFNENL